jgi:hypothetical protein
MAWPCFEMRLITLRESSPPGCGLAFSQDAADWHNDHSRRLIPARFPSLLVENLNGR